MGIYYDTATVIGVRLLQLVEDAWFTVKEHVGPDFHQIFQTEFQTFVGNPEFRVEWAHPATVTLDPMAVNNQTLIWLAT
jgi:hypothetical protein